MEQMSIKKIQLKKIYLQFVSVPQNMVLSVPRRNGEKSIEI